VHLKTLLVLDTATLMGFPCVTRIMPPYNDNTPAGAFQITAFRYASRDIVILCHNLFLLNSGTGGPTKRFQGRAVLGRVPAWELCGGGCASKNKNN